MKLSVALHRGASLCFDKRTVYYQFSWRRGFEDSRGQGFKGLFSKDFISAFNILSISAMSFLSGPNQLSSIAPEFDAFQAVVHVVHVPSSGEGRLMQVFQNNETQEGIGFLGQRVQ
jgi:hypothetical protein